MWFWSKVAEVVKMLPGLPGAGEATSKAAALQGRRIGAGSLGGAWLFPRGPLHGPVACSPP